MKNCPKCGKGFECNNADILNCGCAQVPLNTQANQLIAEQYDGCLCVSCLKEFAELAKTPKLS